MNSHDEFWHFISSRLITDISCHLQAFFLRLAYQDWFDIFHFFDMQQGHCNIILELYISSCLTIDYIYKSMPQQYFLTVLQTWTIFNCGHLSCQCVLALYKMFFIIKAKKTSSNCHKFASIASFCQKISKLDQLFIKILSGEGQTCSVLMGNALVWSLKSRDISREMIYLRTKVNLNFYKFLWKAILNLITPIAYWYDMLVDELQTKYWSI